MSCGIVLRPGNSSMLDSATVLQKREERVERVNVATSRSRSNEQDTSMVKRSEWMLIKIYTILNDLSAAGLESSNLPPCKERYLTC